MRVKIKLSKEARSHDKGKRRQSRVKAKPVVSDDDSDEDLDDMVGYQQSFSKNTPVLLLSGKGLMTFYLHAHQRTVSPTCSLTLGSISSCFYHQMMSMDHMQRAVVINALWDQFISFQFVFFFIFAAGGRLIISWLERLSASVAEGSTLTGPLCFKLYCVLHEPSAE